MMNNYEQYYNYLNMNNMDYMNMNSINNVQNMSDFNKINQTSKNANKSFADPYTAFVRGNLFNSLYDPYKNYKVLELNPSNEKEYALLLVQIYDFCAHELTLYLDNYPNDSNAIKLRDEYANYAREALNNYESKYGALTLASTTLNGTPWSWDTNKWPWEGNN